MTPPPTLHLMCGLPGAGKTTEARRLEQEQRALRLTPDEWIWAMHGDDGAAARDSALRTALEAAMIDVAMRVLSLGTNVVLDFGLWTRAEREDLRARAAAVGARSELHFLDAPIEILLARLAGRNTAPSPGAFAIDEDELRLWSTWLERPAADELLPREPPETPPP